MSAVLTVLDVTDLDQDEAGAPIHVNSGELIAVDAVWDGTDNPDGTLKWQYSKDYVPARSASATWRDVENGAFTTSPDGTGAGSTSEVFNSLSGWVRVYWQEVGTATGTNATMTVTVERNYTR